MILTYALCRTLCGSVTRDISSSQFWPRLLVVHGFINCLTSDLSFSSSSSSFFCSIYKKNDNLRVEILDCWPNRWSPIKLFLVALLYRYSKVQSLYCMYVQKIRPAKCGRVWFPYLWSNPPLSFFYCYNFTRIWKQGKVMSLLSKVYSHNANVFS